jgi:hypothetical protein
MHRGARLMLGTTAMATDTRANQLTAPDYLYIRLFIVSMFVRNHICEPKSVGTQRFGCVKAIKKNAAATNSFAIRRFRASSPLIQRMHFFN